MTHNFVRGYYKNVKRCQSAEHTKQRLMEYAALRCEVSRRSFSFRRDAIRESEIGNNSDHLGDLKTSNQQVEFCSLHVRSVRTGHSVVPQTPDRTN
jgi:hypothetical protein